MGFEDFFFFFSWKVFSVWNVLTEKIQADSHNVEKVSGGALEKKLRTDNS